MVYWKLRRRTKRENASFEQDYGILKIFLSSSTSSFSVYHISDRCKMTISMLCLAFSFIFYFFFNNFFFAVSRKNIFFWINPYMTFKIWTSANKTSIHFHRSYLIIHLTLHFRFCLGFWITEQLLNVSIS